MAKKRDPRRKKVDDELTVTDVLVAEILEGSNYCYFLTDMVVKLIEDYSVTDEFLINCLQELGCSESEGKEFCRLLGREPKIQDLAFHLTGIFPGFVVVEEVIGKILLSQGFHYGNPLSRSLMGQKMLESVTTNLVTDPTKRAFVGRLGNNLIQRFIQT